MTKQSNVDIAGNTGFIALKVIGPFNESTGMDVQLPPELEIDLNKQYDGKINLIGWQSWTREKQDEPRLNFAELFDNESGIGYALTYVYCRRASEAILVGEKECIETVFINKKEIFNAEQNGGKDVSVPLKLRWGYSSILIKFNKQKQGPGFWAGLTKADGKPATNFAMTDYGIIIDGIGHHWKTAADQTNPVEPIPDLLVMSNLDMFFGKSPLDKNQELQIGDPETEWKRADPDIIVYKPKEGDLYDGDNEHFLVFESPDGNELLAMWTQGTTEPSGDNHIVLARSKDGVNFSEPKYVAGTKWGSL